MNMPGEGSAAMTDFHQQYNVSYLDPLLPRATFAQALKHYLASASVYGVALVIISSLPFYRDLLKLPFRGYTASQLYVYGYLAYLAIAPLIIFTFRPRSLWVSKNLFIVGYLARVARRAFRRPRPDDPPDCRPTYHQKHALAFFFIKLFYGPLMVNSALIVVNESSILDRAFPAFFKALQEGEPLAYVGDRAYKLFLASVFLVDSMLFAFGYHSESGLLNNKLRYAETNPLHILVTIVCYAPFNMATGAFLGTSSQNPHILFCGDLTHPMTWILRGFAVVFLLLLTAASCSLFTKASNLTNRGIVCRGPYRIIRHPGYLGKNLFWLTTIIPVLVPNPAAPLFTWPGYWMFFAMTVWGFCAWGTVYFLRAITEERFLMRDPDYVAYCQKVKYRFIPGVY